jgi:hypothetical protein
MVSFLLFSYSSVTSLTPHQQCSALQQNVTDVALLAVTIAAAAAAIVVAVAGLRSQAASQIFDWHLKGSLCKSSLPSSSISLFGYDETSPRPQPARRAHKSLPLLYMTPPGMMTLVWFCLVVTAGRNAHPL